MSAKEFWSEKDEEHFRALKEQVAALEAQRNRHTSMIQAELSQFIRDVMAPLEAKMPMDERRVISFLMSFRREIVNILTTGSRHGEDVIESQAPHE